ncbi:MAG: S-layer homology domain-containing protein [Oscillospiraceae bacterium]|nr:S-layer homology domain-containing protein [Oscillospiraceae bacterium]
MKRFFALLLSFAILICPFVVHADTYFADIEGHWAEQDIIDWTKQGFFKGDEFGNFNPENEINRAEFAVILSRIMNYPDVNAYYNTYFTDLPIGTWFTESIIQARKAKIFMGDEGGTVRPADSISRQEMTIFICRILGISPMDNLLDFDDNDDIAPFAYPYVAALQDLQIVNGYPDNTFRPQEAVTRAETVHILANAITHVIQSTTTNFNAKYTIVNTKNIALQNANIFNNLIISEGLNKGNLLLDNVRALEDLIIRGYKESIQVMDEGIITIKGNSTAKNMIIDNENYVVIEIYPNVVIDNIEIRTPCKIINYGNIYNIVVFCDGVSIDTVNDINVYGNADVNEIELPSDMDENGLFPTFAPPQNTPNPVTMEPWATLLPSATPNAHHNTPNPATFEPQPTLPPATTEPTAEPTLRPTVMPTVIPTIIPTGIPTSLPTAMPTIEPTILPTQVPTPLPTMSPTLAPGATEQPTSSPTYMPSPLSTAPPTVQPTSAPTNVPTELPTQPPISGDIPQVEAFTDVSWRCYSDGQLVDGSVKNYFEIIEQTDRVVFVSIELENGRISEWRDFDRQNMPAYFNFDGMIFGQPPFWIKSFRFCFEDNLFDDDGNILENEELWNTVWREDIFP